MKKKNTIEFERPIKYFNNFLWHEYEQFFEDCACITQCSMSGQYCFVVLHVVCFCEQKLVFQGEQLRSTTSMFVLMVCCLADSHLFPLPPSAIMSH